MKIIPWFTKKLSNISTNLKKGFDIRDVLLFGGLAIMGYGLYLLRPWIGFSVTGLLLMLAGYTMRGK